MKDTRDIRDDEHSLEKISVIENFILSVPSVPYVPFSLFYHQPIKYHGQPSYLTGFVKFAKV
jgi:hypothetical protein